MFKNPMFYYVVIPILAAFWPLSVWSKYLPEARSDVEQYHDRVMEAEELMVKILQRDPSRQDHAGNENGKPKFSYLEAADRAARLCSIRPENYKVNAQARIGGGGGKPETQSATIPVKNVRIEQAAEFIWKIQLHWPGLECTRIKLSHKKGEKNLWDADLNFNYEF